MSTETFQAKILGLQRNLLNFAYSLTMNRDDAHDLLQDTTLKALDSRDKYVDNINIKGWLFTIMRNIFINNYRRKARSAVYVDTSDDLYLLNLPQESGLENPEGAYSAKEITDIMHSLNDDLRTPFSLYIAGYKYAEIANEMCLPIGTVKSRIFLARRRLKELSGYNAAYPRG